MYPTDILKAEHRVIEQVLNCLEKIADACARKGALEGDSAAFALDFFGHFADCCHHAKEERHLFPLMEERGFRRDGGPTGIMLAEHDQGRHYLRGMRASADGASAGNADAVLQFVMHARAYVSLLRVHIAKEDHYLFPMAHQALSEEDQRGLLESFGEVEQDDLGPGAHEKYLRIADELAERWGVSHAGGAAGHACMACGHPASVVRIRD
jgi:hemerythrin-like domain-containing protein